LLRDARIAPIYEGTNGIQAIDLVTRKLPMDDGVHLDAFISELRAMSGEVRSSGQAGIGGIADRLDAALGDLAAASGWLARALREGRLQEALAGATPYLRLIALAAAGTMLAKGAAASRDEAQLLLARYFTENLLGETAT